MLKKFVFTKISTIEMPKYSKLNRYVNKARKLYRARYKCHNKRDPKIFNLNKMAIHKKAYLLSFFSRHYHKIMKLKCKARRYLSSRNCVSHMTNYVNFKLSKDVEKNLGPTQHNTDHHEVMIRPFMQNHSSTMQLTSAISSANLMQSRLGDERLTIFMQSRVPLGPGKFHVVVLVIGKNTLLFKYDIFYSSKC